MALNPIKYSLIVERGMCPERVVDFTITTLSKNNIIVPKIIPAIVDLRNKLPVIYDQGNLGSCTANALCYCFDYVDDTNFYPSRLFLYYNVRMLDKNVNQDAGSTLTQGIVALEKYGISSENLWPYIIPKFRDKPSPNAYLDASKHKLLSAKRVQQTMSSMKGCLQSGFPFVTGIMIYSSFESNVATKTGYIPMPNTRTERLLGGHAVTCVGYNDTRGVWIMKNSWGTGWGDNGNFYLPYNYLLSASLSGDLWQITKVYVISTPRKIMVNKKLEQTKFLNKK
jgi:C1A family cysteine protease